MTGVVSGGWRSLPWFLRTPPSPPPEAIERERIADVLEQAVAANRVVLVAAPSGFGKTISVAHWARTRPNTGWLSATRASDTLTLLRGGLLHSQPPEVQQKLKLLEPGQEAPTVAELLASRQATWTMVIDDAHLLDPQIVTELLLNDSVLASNAVRVVLVGQPVLEQEFSRQIATGVAAVLRPEQFALNLEEVAAIAAATNAVPTDPAMLLELTAGWPIAVRLALRADQELDLELRPSERASIPDPLLTDYIATTVLPRLPGELAQFVLDSATCARLDAVLAEELTGRSDSAALLEECVRTGLFLDRFRRPGGRVLYRWHETFAVHCRALLEARDPQRASTLHQRAAELLAEQFPTEAINHALRGGIPELATQIIRRNWLRLLLESQSSTLVLACLELPAPWRELPEILLIRACCCELVGDVSTALVLREQASKAWQPDGSASTELVRWFAELLLAASPDKKAVAADRAFELLKSNPADMDQPHALFLLGWAELRLRRDPERAILMLSEAQHEAQRHGLKELARHAAQNAAFALTYGGRFSAAEAALAALSVEAGSTEWDRFDGGVVSFSRGYISYWRGDFAQALVHCDEAISSGAPGTSFVGLALVYRVLSIAALRLEVRYDEARESAERIPMEDKNGVPWAAYRRMAAARLFEAQNEIDLARRAADPLLERAGIPVTLALLAEFYRGLGQHKLAQLAIKGIGARECPDYARISVTATLAGIAFSHGRTTEAHTLLDRALKLANAERVLAPFLSGDQNLAQLLEAHALTGSPHEVFLAEIFAARRFAGGQPTVSLSPREQELIGFLRTAMTGQEIADALHLSLATVKTHLRSLYRKLGVNTRREAVRRAPR